MKFMYWFGKKGFIKPEIFEDKLREELDCVRKEQMALDERTQKLELVLSKQLEQSACDDNYPVPKSKNESECVPDEDIRQELALKDKEIERLKACIAELQAKLDAGKGDAAAEKTNNEPEGILSESIVDSLARISEDFQKLHNYVSIENMRLSDENAEIRKQLEDKQVRLEHIVQTCQEDRYRKDKIKLINKYIYQIDLIRKTLYDFDIDRANRTAADAAEFLENQLREIVKGMEAALAHEMVECVQSGCRGGIVNPDMQETVDTVVTEDPELDGKIYCSVSPGYVWTLPYILKAKVADNGDEIKTYRFLIRPEQIVTYKLNK